jgi:hypothetical protein
MMSAKDSLVTCAATIDGRIEGRWIRAGHACTPAGGRFAWQGAMQIAGGKFHFMFCPEVFDYHSIVTCENIERPLLGAEHREAFHG